MSWIDDIAAALLRAVLPSSFGPTEISDGAGGTVLDYSSAVARIPTVRAATTAALSSFTRSVNTITASSNGALGSIDGVALSVGDVLLVKDESTGANNGPYQITATGSVSEPWSAARVAWFNDSHNALPGTLIYCVEGTANAKKLFVCSTAGTITLNTTALTFEQPDAV